MKNVRTMKNALIANRESYQVEHCVKKTTQSDTSCLNHITFKFKEANNIINFFHAALHVHIHGHQNKLNSLYLSTSAVWVISKTNLVQGNFVFLVQQTEAIQLEPVVLLLVMAQWTGMNNFNWLSVYVHLDYHIFLHFSGGVPVPCSATYVCLMKQLKFQCSKTTLGS